MVADGNSSADLPVCRGGSGDLPCVCRSARHGERGVTLLEMLIVVGLIAVITGLSYPSVSAGLESLRMRQATEAVSSFLTTALDRADRRQEVVQVEILPASNVMLARGATRAGNTPFVSRLDVPSNVRILTVTPPIPGARPDQPRRFLIYPGGSVPRIGVELLDARGRHRLIWLDPITAVAHTEEVAQ